MTANLRLLLSAVMIALSAGYAVVVSYDPQVATAIASGYVGFLLTLIVLTNVWKKP